VSSAKHRSRLKRSILGTPQKGEKVDAAIRKESRGKEKAKEKENMCLMRGGKKKKKREVAGG